MVDLEQGRGVSKEDQGKPHLAREAGLGRGGGGEGVQEDVGPRPHSASRGASARRGRARSHRTFQGSGSRPGGAGGNPASATTVRL